MKITVFGASYSQQSINRKFAGWAAKQFINAEVDLLDLNDFPVPMFTVDKEAEIGSPSTVEGFLSRLGGADLLVISMSEHNGSYTAAFKNLMDWSSFPATAPRLSPPFPCRYSTRILTKKGGYLMKN